MEFEQVTNRIEPISQFVKLNKRKVPLYLDKFSSYTKICIERLQENIRLEQVKRNVAGKKMREILKVQYEMSIIEDAMDIAHSTETKPNG